MQQLSLKLPEQRVIGGGFTVPTWKLIHRSSGNI